MSILTARRGLVAALCTVLLTAGCAGAGQSATPAVPATSAPVPAASPAATPAETSSPATPAPSPAPDPAENAESQRIEVKPVALRKIVPGTPSASAGGRVNPPPPGSVDCSTAKCIALTFDDGPGPHTERLLGMLTSSGARATFFVQGVNVRANPGVARRIAATPGMELGDHSSTHPQLTAVGSAQLRREVVGNHATIREVTGKSVTVFRPPYGARNSTVDAMAAEAGESVILWDVDTLDWKTRSASATRRAVAQQARSGSIVLMHDIHGSTVDAVPGIISDLQGQGYVLVTVTELLGGTTPGRVYSRR